MYRIKGGDEMYRIKEGAIKEGRSDVQEVSRIKGGDQMCSINSAMGSR